MATYSMRDRDVKPEIVCPYNQHHQVSKNKLTEHVKKCRRNWRLEQYKKDDEIHVFTCQHNPEHLVVAPELMWHEARCHDRGKVRGYQLNVQPFKDAGLWDFDLDLEDYPPDAKEQGEIWKGVKLGVITSASVDTWGAAVYAEEIKYPSLKKIREAREKEEAAVKERERLEKERLEEIRRSKMTQEERDEEDYWNKTNPGPGFDYWYSMTDPDVKWRRMPIHLTKAQRKKWGQVEKPKAVVEVEEETDGAQAEEEPTSPVVARPSSPVAEPLSFVTGPTYSEVAQGTPPAKQPPPHPVTEEARQVEPTVEKPLAPVKETLPTETVPEAAVLVTPVIQDTLPAVSGKETLEASLEVTTPTVAEETAIEAEESLPPSAETSTQSEETLLPTPETLPAVPEAAKLVNETGPAVTEPPALGAALEETTTKSTVAETETPAEEPSPLPPSPSKEAVADALPPAAETLQTAKPAPTAKEPALEETTPTSTVAETPAKENLAPPPPPPSPSQVTPPIVTELATPVEETPPKQAVTEMETPMEVDAPPPSPEDDFDLDALDNQTLEGMIDCIDIKVMEAEEHPETFNADEMEGFLNIRKRCLIIIRNRTQERLNAVEEKEKDGQSAA